MKDRILINYLMRSNSRFFVISPKDYIFAMFVVRFLHLGSFVGAPLSALQLHLIALKKNLIFLKKNLIFFEKNLNFDLFCYFLCYKEAQNFI